MTVRQHTARTAALLIWSSFFVALLITGGVSHYLGSRTAWVIPFGAAITGAAAAMLIWHSRSAPARPLSRREAAGLLGLLAPILVVLAVPDAQLGASTAERRAGSDAAIARIALSPQPNAFARIMAARTHPELGVRSGEADTLTGFVMHRSGTPASMFQVTRFLVTCCVADAIPLFVTVDPRGALPPRDAWVEVSGTLTADRGDRVPGDWILTAERIDRVAAPANPYLTPTDKRAYHPWIRPTPAQSPVWSTSTS
jgi:uncharacterized repeat protein (TIGR03943 family)